jgi:alpha-maltose-1-phosphate synthase
METLHGCSQPSGCIGFPVDTSKVGCSKNLQSIFGAVKRCFDFNATGIDAGVVHCHTWYTRLEGILVKLNYGIPLVITVHSRDSSGGGES